jgi:hypothetical protein
LCSRRSTLAALEEVSIDGLAGLPMVMPRADRAARSHRVLVERLLAAAGVAPRIAYEVDDLPAAQALARAELAVVLMHELTIPASHPGIAVRPLRGGEEGTRASADGLRRSASVATSRHGRAPGGAAPQPGRD